MKRWRCRPTESATIALRTQQIILHESGVAATVDPVGGAYAIEEMTNSHRAGRPSSCSIGFSPWAGRSAQSSPAMFNGRFRTRPTPPSRRSTAAQAVMVGVNRYVDNAPGTARVFQIDPDIERQQTERVRAVRATRNEADWRAALAAVDSAARGGDNLVPP